MKIRNIGDLNKLKEAGVSSLLALMRYTKKWSGKKIHKVDAYH